MTQSDKATTAAALAPDVRHPRIEPTTVNGWGIDADPDNDPTWPMRDRSQDDGPGANWTPPEAQVVDIEVLQSLEYLRRPAVVGQSPAPSGMSGSLRRAAYGFSESQWGHWLILMLADRVNSVEGLVDDLVSGRPPNLLVEIGMVKRSHARGAAVASVAGIALAIAGLVWFARRRR